MYFLKQPSATGSMTLAELDSNGHRPATTAASASAAGPGTSDGLIVLKKDDLNTILTSKPAVLIGRELVSPAVVLSTSCCL